MELTQERKKCFKRYFDDVDLRRQVNIEFANFSGKLGDFADEKSLRDRGKMDAKSWWIIHGSHAPILQNIALKLLGQPCSSCCERNWSAYSFIHSLKRNKMTPKRAEDLVFVHSNLHLLSRNLLKYRKRKLSCGILLGMTFHLTVEFLILLAYLSMNQN